MSSCSRKKKNQQRPFYSIDKQPVRLDMTLSKPGIVSNQLVIMIFAVELFSFGQLVNDLIQMF